MTGDPGALNDLGNDLKNEGRLAEAEEAYRRAIALAPAWSAPWFNLGLVHKLQRRWADCARSNLQAVELDPEDEGAWWNIGIAATALRDWALARRAWRKCGLAIVDGEGPPALPHGLTPIRLKPEASAEVVWCDGIDPARAVIRSVPLPASGYHEGDTLLRDGAPNGYRWLEGRQVPVFDALERLEASGRQTFEARVDAPGPEAIESLERLAGEAGVVLEDWSTIRHLCRLCSEGVQHEEHDPASGPWQERRRLGFSAASRHPVLRILTEWEASAPGRRLIDLEPGTSGE